MCPLLVALAFCRGVSDGPAVTLTTREVVTVARSLAVEGPTLTRQQRTRRAQSESDVTAAVGSGPRRRRLGARAVLRRRSFWKGPRNGVPRQSVRSRPTESPRLSVSRPRDDCEDVSSESPIGQKLIALAGILDLKESSARRVQEGPGRCTVPASVETTHRPTSHPAPFTWSSFSCFFSLLC